LDVAAAAADVLVTVAAFLPVTEVNAVFELLDTTSLEEIASFFRFMVVVV
jgi:hypothetical protein